MEIINLIQNKLPVLQKKKWLIGIGAASLLVVLLNLFLLLSISKKSNVTVSPTKFPQALPTSFATPTLSAEQQQKLQQAVNEAKQSAQEYDAWQANLKVDYPWLRKLPLGGEKYFVYYDLNKDSFIGRLYPAAGDDVEQMKADILRHLKEVKKIPVEKYTFEWVVSPEE